VTSVWNHRRMVEDERDRSDRQRAALEYLRDLATRRVADARQRSGAERTTCAAAAIGEVIAAMNALEAVGLLEPGLHDKGARRVHERFLAELESLAGRQVAVLRQRGWWWQLRHRDDHPVRLVIGAAFDWGRDVVARQEAPVVTGLVPGPFRADSGDWCVSSLERWSTGGRLHLASVAYTGVPPRVISLEDDLGTKYVVDGGGGGGGGHLWCGSCRFAPAVPTASATLTVVVTGGSLHIDLSRTVPTEATIDAASWLAQQVEEALRVLADNPAIPDGLRPGLLDRLEAQAAALLATGALDPAANPVPALRDLLADRGQAAAGTSDGPAPPERWLAILDHPTPPPRLVAVAPVLWNPQVLSHAELWVTALEIWSDHTRVTWSVVGSHGAWHDVARSAFALTDNRGTAYALAGSGMGSHSHDPPTVDGYTTFHPALPSAATSITLTVTRGRRYTHRDVALPAAPSPSQ
jgi:hypothetical protein